MRKMNYTIHLIGGGNIRLCNALLIGITQDRKNYLIHNDQGHIVTEIVIPQLDVLHVEAQEIIPFVKSS